VSEFSAAAPALGYLHQIRYALVLILDDENAFLRLEALDDIEVNTHDQSPKLFQLKHRAEGTAFTDFSTDLWKTIRIWATQIANNEITAPDTRFVLVTTATAAADSAAAILRDDDVRDPPKANERLLKAANTSSNSELATAISAFKALSKEQRERLISNIFVLDNAANITHSRTALEKKLAVAVSKQHRAPLADRLEGWWMNRCILHLSGKLPYLAGQEVFENLYALAQQFQPDWLPIDCINDAPTTDEVGKLSGRIFVEQLQRIQVNADRIQNAILDYYRAFTQRSRWVKDGLIVDSDLNAYEDRLYDEWNRIKLALEDELAEPVTDDALMKLGRDLLKWMEFNADLRIRQNVSAPYVMRGSYHMLADHSPPRVQWHRDFVSQVKSFITQGAA
jgi:hypothetical protein